jgi:hypothetical protein
MKAMSREDIAFFVHAISMHPQVEKCLSVGNVLVLQMLKVARSFPTSRVGCASEIGWIGSGGRCKFSERASRPEQFIRFNA